MEIIILTKNPQGQIIPIVCSRWEYDDSPPLCVFSNKDEADEIAQSNPLCEAWGYQLVEVEL